MQKFYSEIFVLFVKFTPNEQNKLMTDITISQMNQTFFIYNYKKTKQSQKNQYRSLVPSKQ